MWMQDLGPTRLTSEQTGIFPTSEHGEDTWRHNYTSEKIDNQKWDDSSNFLYIPMIKNQIAK